MPDKILLVFLGLDLAFLGCAVIHLLIPVMTHAALNQPPTVDKVATNLLLDHCPLTAATIDAILMFTTFLLSLPALFMRRNRIFLVLHACGVVACAVLTLVIGLVIWYSTLQTRQNFAPVWNSQPALVQSLLQFKFECCGYSNPSLFVKDTTCPTAVVAARLGPCEVPFGTYANQFLDIVFTSFFGFVAVDAMLLLSAMCLIKDRQEKARYRFIDEKRGMDLRL